MSETAPDPVKYPRRWTMGGFVYKDDNGDWVPEETPEEAEAWQKEDAFYDSFDWEAYVRNSRDLIEGRKAVLSADDVGKQSIEHALSDHNPHLHVPAQDTYLEEMQDKINNLKAAVSERVYEDDCAACEGPCRDESSPREELLDEAKRLIMGQRNNTYGPPTQDFQRSAEAMTAMGYRSASGPIQAHDVAILVTLVKISRLQWSPEKYDSWADIAGYAACGWECVEDE